MNGMPAVPVPRPDWAALPRPGCRGVEFKVLLQQPTLVLALLRFGPHGTIDEHSAIFPADVICLEGAGSFSVDGEPATLRAGESVRWPSNRPHRLWTDDSTMTTLMVEHRTA
jgi:quercetin dioxygenase-like cupin family protein